MCEQTPVEYKDGDVVWVKLGSCWWPGEVQDLDKIPEDSRDAFKKPIIAAVKFFDEDYYEFIKSLDRIYLYNCSKKNEFIKKGLDLHRAKHEYMKKFPDDVSKAETKTNGDPNIIEDPIFAPEKKTNIAALIFGNPKQKKSPKKSASSLRKSLGSKSTSLPKSSNRLITHPRFLGQDDHEVRILLQSPEQPKPDVVDEEKVSYKCVACGFTTERIDVSITHHKSHIQGHYSTPLTSPKTSKRPYAKRNKKVLKMTKSKTSSIIEDLDLIDKGIFFQTESSDNDTLGSSCESEPEVKRRRKKGKKKVVAKKEDIKKPTAVVDIRVNLLAEWDDESDSENELSLNSSSAQMDLDTTSNDIVNHEEVEDKQEKKTEDTKKDDKSCFDFDDEEEHEIVGTSVGRKIPRVIPPPDRQKSTDSEEADNNISPPENNSDPAQTSVTVSSSDEVSVPDDCNQEPILSSVEESDDLRNVTSKSEEVQVQNETQPHEKKEENKGTVSKEDDEKDKKLDETDDLAFKDILEATAVPELPAIPHSLKFEQNFHDSKKVKFPDKANDHSTKVEVKETEITAKLINPKKRFVKSFEDFEQQIYNEQRKLLEMEQNEKLQEKLKQESDDMIIKSDVVTKSDVVAKSDVVSKSDDTTEKKLDKSAVVEVSKLKTQLMFKLGNPELRPRLPKDRVLSSPKGDSEQLTNSTEKSNENEISKNLVLNVIGPPSPPKICELPDELLESSISDVGNNSQSEVLPVIKVLEVDVPCEKQSDFTMLSPVPTEVPQLIETQTTYSSETVSIVDGNKYNLKGRLSLKMHEVNETKSPEIKEETELLELDTKVQLESTEPLEVTHTREPAETIVEMPNTDVSDVVIVKCEEKQSEINLEDDVKLTEQNFTENVIEESLITEEHMDTSPVFEETMEITKEDGDAPNDTAIADSNISMDPTISFSCTNLDNQNKEDLSALTTLATISELSTNLDIHCTSSSEKSKIIEGNIPSCTDFKDKSNLSFVTMDDLAEAQVEISDSAISKIKSQPISLSSFSVDFQDSNEATNISSQSENLSGSVLMHLEQTNQPDLIEMSLGKVFEGENDSSGPRKLIKSDSTDSFDTSYDLEDQIPSLLVRSSKPSFKKLKAKIAEKTRPEYSSSSKLLEILTDGKPKPFSSDETASQKSPAINTWNKEDKKDASPVIKTLSKPKDGKLFNPLKDLPAIAKHVSKSKDKELPTITKISPKVKDDKIYTITKESPITKAPSKFESKNSKFLLKAAPSLKPFATTTTNKSNKPIILSEKIIKTLSEPTETVSVQKVTSKRTTQDVEDIDTFIIQKPPKKIMLHDEHDVENLPKKNVGTKGKAKILQQTIIKPGGDIVQPATTTIDDSMFDINSMPIVLGDQILTTDGIENMPVVITETHTPPSTKPQSESRILLNKTVTTQPVVLKTYSSHKLGKSRIYQTTPTSTTKILKSNPAIISRPGKQDKYIILPSSNAPTTSKYTVGKKQSAAKRMTPVVLPTPNVNQKIQTTTSAEPSGNKIMIVTNQQGQQSRVLLTPAQQKLFGYPPTGSKLVKSALKGNILQKTNPKTSVLSPVSNVHSKVISSQDTIISSNASIATEPVLMPIKSGTPLRNIKSLPPKGGKFQIQPQKLSLQDSLNTFKGQQKTIVIKNQQGHIVKKLHGTDDAFLEQQVAEQVQAIKASGSFSTTNKIKPPLKRSYKKPEAQKNVKLMTTTTSKVLKNETVPPLAPISPKKTDSLLLPQTVLKTADSKVEAIKTDITQQKPVNQLIIQDALGNQTTIMEGQILALPSGDTIDGQPQSYMLVTLDESGNLTPLNNEALLSLDPNLSLGGDLSNMVLQLDDGSNKKTIDPNPSTKSQNLDIIKEESLQVVKQESSVEASKLDTEALNAVEQQNVQTVTCSLGNDPNQQLIITGDPISTQKFIESLTEGNPDLANLLASAEGNILIQTDEQQILINTDSDNQVLLPLNSGVIETSESESNPIFATQPLKNQDILAAALADTDVFQQEQTVSPVHSKMAQAQLSPNSGLYQTGVGNVLETTLSLSSPIMTPLEVPSTNNKKIPDEEMDILTTEVPKNVDLPITITDPNISQTVAQQQVVSLMASDLSTNLDLPLTIAESSIAPLTSAEMHSPSFGYPLSTLEESVVSVDVQKSFSGPISMPLLTEDPQETITDNIVEESEVPPEQIIEEKHEESIVLGDSIKDEPDDEETLKQDFFENSALTDSIIKDDAKSPSKTFLGTSIETEEGLCTLGGAMCSSLSEPPPDMFDLSLVGSHYVTDNEIKSSVAGSIRSEGSTTQETVEEIESTNELTESNDTFNKFESYEVETGIENNLIEEEAAPQISNSNSPVVNVDENSCEIPVQPQIVTDLSSTSFECMDVDDFESNKRVDSDYDTESDRKKIEFD
ncbi:hypothetical protein FQR65_LT12482 [Abscondita terminalis]|nr:hypothetical protein FQR65_LT12482 [Abscondita terminalis]